MVGPIESADRPFSAVIQPVSGVQVDIALLGPVEFRCAVRPFRRAAARDLVAYLACHREGVLTGQWVEALWPIHPVSPTTVHSTVSDARGAVGRDADGRPRMVRARGRLRLVDRVVTDVDLFGELSGSDDPWGSARALRLVRGVPLSGLRSCDWAVLDGTQAELEAMIVRTALTECERLLAHGDATGAEGVVQRALLASPYDERLYRSLLRVTAAQGNRARLPATMARLRVLAGEAGSLPRGGSTTLSDLLHPETTALYEHLLHGKPAAEGSAARL